MKSRMAILSTSLFAMAVIIMAVSVTLLSSNPLVRLKIDATKSRAYSLSLQTRQLLSDLKGQWTVAVVLVEEEADPATVRQVDEVLERFAQAGPDLRVKRIDPTRPASLRDYEALIIELQNLYREEIDLYDEAISRGIQAFRNLMQFATVIAAPMREEARASSPSLQSELVPRIGALSLLAAQGELVIDEVEKGLEVDEGRPLPDYAAAITILIQALSQWAEEIDDLARLLGDEGASLLSLSQQCLQEAAKLAISADRLKRLPEMELARISRHLQSGEAAIVMGPSSAAVVPAGQLFAGALSGDVDRVTFDRRFRGEQLLSSAIRSLVEGIDPTVVFVHAEDRSMLQSSPQNVDVSGAAAMLEAARVQVMEWAVMSDQRPVLKSGSPVVWIILSPSRRTGLKPGEAEIKLLRTTADLLSEGEPICVSLYPSLLHRYGQRDPWAELVGRLGVDVKTGEVIAESRRGPDGEDQVQLIQILTEFTTAHPIAAALHGQSLALPLPLPVGRNEQGMAEEVIFMAKVQPSSNKWLADDWSPQDQASLRQDAGSSLTKRTPLIAAVERPSPVGTGMQRVLVVGSGGWMLNYVADMVMSAGGDRYALLYPGNHELLLSGAAWLAGLDDRIAQGPLSQEVARLGSIPESTRTIWMWLLLLGMPGLIAMAGIGVWLVRQS
ncbi:MAG: hypothetical protein CMJ39_13140 [Phycisphaerae bacterium]|nr:hypothetical protein [Phycisphaerae bacterium]